MMSDFILYETSAGFTLIECLWVLFIIGVLSCFTFFSMTGLLQKNQFQVIADDIKFAVHMAKIQSLVHMHPVILGPPCGHHQDWSKGMVLLLDNLEHHCISQTQIIREWHWDHPGLEVHWRGFESKDYLRFTPDIARRSVNGYFLIKNLSHDPKRVVINRIGKVRVEKI